jgi:hypothetical protein
MSANGIQRLGALKMGDSPSGVTPTEATAVLDDSVDSVGPIR